MWPSSVGRVGNADATDASAIRGRTRRRCVSVADRMVAKGDEIKIAAQAAREDGELLKYLLLAVLGHVSVTGGAELRKLVRDRGTRKT